MTYKLNKSGLQVDRDLSEGLDNQPKGTYVWDDWSFDVNRVRINAVTSKPDFDQTEIAHLFDDSSTETVYATGITPHKIKAGVSGLTWRPHVHWIQKASGTVVWELQYRTTPSNSLESGSWTTILSTTDEFTYTSGSLHQITIFPYIDASSFTSTAFIFDFKLSRLGGDASDTYTGDAFFKSFDIHVPIDQLGSREEFTK